MEQEGRRNGSRVVLIVEEAHLLSPAQLEELRLLTNADMDSRTPFAMLLVGQPTLARQLRMDVFAACVAAGIMLLRLGDGVP